ncbi:GIY-YIG nuclease family protein [Massilia sp. DJPM01]|uniref:GIY-YIG nuclease family protein n=1 Tax=Massilia sp. DJPM01 TaxID=3024404 RepID=UPI00259F1306|nr:GIY-YIG nuclease family protein [Massilia sp. DJPM01]MDM5181739.1 GIY-YIG nuclease family protein [Massilia sp. DJPM01]
MRRLLQIGFEQVGSWRLRGQELALELARMNGQRNVLYAFVQDTTVLYVGKTTGSLESRMGGYLRPHASQRTNVRNNQALLHLLRQDHALDIYAWADTGMHRIGDFHLNYAAGLEDSIIRIVTPPWNGARSAPSAAAAPDEPPLPPVPAIAEPPAPQSPAPTEGESASASEVLALEEAGVIQASPVFEVALGKTYYHNGFFNVPVKFSGLFPEHGTEISIYCGDSRTLIRATVDRKANQANHTPRIYGRASLANGSGSTSAWTTRQPSGSSAPTKLS